MSSQPSGREPHVTRQREFAAPSAHTTGDDRDRRLGHRAQRLAHLVVRTVARELLDRLDVEMRQEPLGVREAEHDGAHRIVVGKPFDLSGELEEDLDGHEVDRRLIGG